MLARQNRHVFYIKELMKHCNGGQWQSPYRPHRAVCPGTQRFKADMLDYWPE